MSLVLTPYAIIFFVTALFAAIVTGMLWRHRSTPGSAPLAWMMVFVCWWNLTAGLEAATVEQPYKILWAQIEYIGSNVSLAFLAFFALEYTRPEKRLSGVQRALLLVLPAVNVLLAATNGWHHLVWQGFEAGPAGSNLLIYQHGPGFYLVMLVVYGYIAMATIRLIRTARHASLLHRRQIGILLLGMIAPLVASILYAFDLNPLPGMDIIPVSFLLTGIFLMVGILFYRLFDLVPVARERLVENMADGLLVLDGRGRLLEYNPAVQRMLGLGQGGLGKDAALLFARWPALAALCKSEQESQTEIAVEGDPPCYLEMHNSILWDPQGRLTGRLILVRNVTRRRNTEIALQQANERLQAQLFEIRVLQAQLQEQAIRDPLTGLFNRRYLEETLPREIARAGRQNYPVVVVMIDIDHFKRVNDTFGHEGGDHFLKAFGSLLASRVRREDIACRYGGEEFLLVFPGLPRECTTGRLEQIREMIENLRIPYQGREISTTASGGIAIFPDHGGSSEEMIRSADLALYAAKAAGRNRMLLFSNSGAG